MLANLTTPLLGIVATAVIGRLGEAHLLGGVAMASVVFDCTFWLFGFLRMSTVALTAQARGADDAAEMRATLARALVVAVAFGAGLLLIQGPVTAIIFHLMGASGPVSDAAKLYFHLRLWSTPFLLANYAVLGWLIGQARAGSALGIQTLINTINIAATTALVLVFGLGIAGAAYAAVIAEASGLGLGLFIAMRILGLGKMKLSRAVLFDRGKILRLMAINRDIVIRTAALIAAFLFFTAQGARGGDTVLAANAILNNFALIGSFFLDGLATAAEQLCGQSRGAHDRANFLRATKLILGWSCAFALAVALALALSGGALIDLMTASEDVRQTARLYLWLAALAPVCGVAAYAYDGIYIGATWSRDMRNLMLAALAIYFLSWAALQPLGNTGLWLALLTFLLARGALQALRYPALLEKSFAA
ncbi:MAG: MATE family efflux transporter [Bradyrhizobiaceae bacterium]|nr:MAG: MATE family efflux transporter [Bradyrhizobiaceae bacterium]